MADLGVKAFIEFILKGTGAKDAGKQLTEVEKKAKKAKEELAGTEKAAKGAGKGLTEAEKKARKAKQELTGTGKAAKDLKRQLTSLVGGAVLAKFAKDAVTLESSIQRGFSAIGQQITSFGLIASEELPKVEGFLESLEDTAGVLVQDAQPSFQKFLGITKDVGGAMFATKLAADLTNAGLGDMSVNAERLANLLQGEVTEAAKALGLQLRNENGAIKTQAQLLEELDDLYGGFSETQTDTQSDIESLGATFNELKRTVGAGLAPVVGFLSRAFDVTVKTVKTLGVAIGVMVDAGMQGFLGLGNVIKKALDIKKLIADPGEFFDGIKAEALETMKDIAASVAAGAELEAEIWEDSVDDFKMAQDGKGAVLEVALSKQREQELAASRRKQQAILQAEIQALDAGSKAKLDKELELLELRRKQEKAVALASGKDTAAIDAQIDAQKKSKIAQFGKTKLQAEKAISDALLAQQIEAAGASSDERLELELELLERQRRIAVDNAIKMGIETQGVNDAFDLARAHKIDGFNRDRAALDFEMLQRRAEAESEVDLAILEQRLANTKENSEARFEVEQAIITARMEAELEALTAQFEAELVLREAAGEDVTLLEQVLADQRLAIQKKADAASVGLTKQKTALQQEQTQLFQDGVIRSLNAIFGANKATAIAGAVISTARGIAKALELTPPYSYVLAALTAAAGAAQVAKIQSTSVQGAGFDDPANDRLATLGGRRWAQDMVQLFSDGFAQGLAGIGDGTAIPGGAAGNIGDTISNVDQSSTQNFNFQGAIISGRVGLRRLKRQLRQSEIDEEHRDIR